jgi:hypothetical protein
MELRKNIFVALMLVLASAPGAALPQGNRLEVEQTVFIKEDSGAKQILIIRSASAFPLQCAVQAEQGGKISEQPFTFEKPVSEVSIFIPACAKEKCSAAIRVLDSNKNQIGGQEFVLAQVRPWKIYMVPFTHIDIGFTQSQKNVLKQNVENLKLELGLIDQTKNYPVGARFKLFTEVSWALDEFFASKEIGEAEKDRLRKAISEKSIEPGAFYISHQNKFMPAEAIFASMLPGLKIADAAKVQLKTACIHDVMDFSNMVAPLSGAGVKYLLVGPNDSRYAVPPLFYLLPPVGNEKVLVWHATGLNGYGENFDLKARLTLPFSDSDFAEMERGISAHLKGLELGYPTKSLSEYYDYFGANWPYPFNAFLLPFYPAQGGDNQPQNIVPSELAKKWNEKWASPKIIVSVPSEFFEYVETNFPKDIPQIRGEMAGFWGEQIFLDLLQVDPDKESKQINFERQAVNSGAALADKFLAGEKTFNPIPLLEQGYKRLILNNDHNPRPVPFGQTKYSGENVREWMQTRSEWVEEMANIGGRVCTLALCPSAKDQARPVEPANAYQSGKDFFLENKFYKIRVDGRTGGIKSLIDKELAKELVNPKAKFQLNQYLVEVRGENAGLRNYLKVKPGFKSVKIKILQSQTVEASLSITGRMERSVDASQALAKFVQKAFGFKVPSGLVKVLERYLGKEGKPITLEQTIALAAGEKRVQFSQTFTGDAPQWAEHIFAYPLNVPGDAPVEYDSGYSLLNFTPGPPLGNGDIIPGARNVKNFPSINFSLAPFQWMEGVPPELTFNNYAMMRGDGFAVAFTSSDSKVIIPGPIEHDPEKGPFSGEFFLLGLGYTAWGKLGLGADLSQPAVIKSSLTSFAARTDSEAREQAFAFSNYRQPGRAKLDPSSVKIVMAWPEDDHTLVMRLWETSGIDVKAEVKFETSKKIKAAYLARSDGKALSAIPFQERSFSTPAPAGETRAVRIEFE